MKIRNGFVSNSSSSSFIIGIARITNEKKLREYIERNNITNVNIIDLENIKNSWELNIRDNKVYLESFVSDISTTIKNDTDKFVYLDSYSGNDSDFWNGDEYDYDIDLDFFDSDEIPAYELFHMKNIGIVDADTSYGAGRDG